MFLSLSNDSSLCLCPQHMLSCSSFREQLGHGVHKARAFAGYSTSLLFPNTLTKLGLSLSPTKQLVTSDAPFIELESQGVTDFPSGGEISFGASCASVCPAPTFSGLSGLPTRNQVSMEKLFRKSLLSCATCLVVGSPHRSQDLENQVLFLRCWV